MNSIDELEKDMEDLFEDKQKREAQEVEDIKEEREEGQEEEQEKLPESEKPGEEELSVKHKSEVSKYTLDNTHRVKKQRRTLLSKRPLRVR